MKWIDRNIAYVSIGAAMLILLFGAIKVGLI